MIDWYHSHSEHLKLPRNPVPRDSWARRDSIHVGACVNRLLLLTSWGSDGWALRNSMGAVSEASSRFTTPIVSRFPSSRYALTASAFSNGKGIR